MPGAGFGNRVFAGCYSMGSPRPAVLRAHEYPCGLPISHLADFADRTACPVLSITNPALSGVLFEQRLGYELAAVVALHHAFVG